MDVDAEKVGGPRYPKSVERMVTAFVFFSGLKITLSVHVNILQTAN